MTDDEMEYVDVRGAHVPKVGLGTWRMADEECYDAVSTALELGYRHVDTAQMYGNEAEVGRAVADADVDRDIGLSEHRVYTGSGGVDLPQSVLSSGLAAAVIDGHGATLFRKPHGDRLPDA